MFGFVLSSMTLLCSPLMPPSPLRPPQRVIRQGRSIHPGHALEQPTNFGLAQVNQSAVMFELIFSPHAAYLPA